MKTVLSVIGARPQFVKAAPLSRALRGRFHEILVHTGQHYDPDMSARFRSELGLPEPDVDLGVGSAGHAEQTARMTTGLVRVLAERKPDVVLTYGDTNSALAASLAAARTGVPLAHVEAGLRSGVGDMPEEVNRVATDHLSDLCLCPTENARKNLEAEGIGDRARLVGDVMLDGCLAAAGRAERGVLDGLELEPGGYYFATVHRASNTDDVASFLSILSAFGRLRHPVVFPAHPRSRAMLGGPVGNVIVIPPAGYFATIALVMNARKVLTDSGGLQKEAFFLGTPCVTLRDTTEWTETVDAGRNRVVGADPDAIVAAAEEWEPDAESADLELYGGGKACERIVGELATLLGG
ncbi:MAG: UDP-N-acetylglucosamine 2-epimerase (non-hydrolyzing) [Planctomycetota bacterium]